MMDMWISFGEGFLLVFAINDKESFTLLRGKHDRVLKGKHRVKCPILLVGNKQDLENERQVTYAEAKAQADSWGIEYMETSAKTNFNCKESFYDTEVFCPSLPNIRLFNGNYGAVYD